MIFLNFLSLDKLDKKKLQTGECKLTQQHKDLQNGRNRNSLRRLVIDLLALQFMFSDMKNYQLGKHYAHLFNVHIW